MELDPLHPARWYIEKYRRVDLQRLTDLYRCSYCTKEYPKGQHNIWYRKFPGGWTDTPQGRIIFYSLHNNVPLTWQGRYPEFVTPDGLNKYGLHPYTEEWSHLATRATAKQAWMPVPPFDEVDEDGHIKFAPSKYKTAKHSGRELMGWDGAIKRADEDDDPIRWCVLTEGPLDGARVGPGGLREVAGTPSGFIQLLRTSSIAGHSQPPVTCERQADAGPTGRPLHAHREALRR
jgi:hypothetical protein